MHRPDATVQHDAGRKHDHDGSVAAIVESMKQTDVCLHTNDAGLQGLKTGLNGIQAGKYVYHNYLFCGEEGNKKQDDCL